jgi:hypothetical protein
MLTVSAVNGANIVQHSAKRANVLSKVVVNAVKQALSAVSDRWLKRLRALTCVDPPLAQRWLAPANGIYGRQRRQRRVRGTFTPLAQS